jgi:hypothetical protein
MDSGGSLIWVCLGSGGDTNSTGDGNLWIKDDENNI